MKHLAHLEHADYASGNNEANWNTLMLIQPTPEVYSDLHLARAVLAVAQV